MEFKSIFKTWDRGRPSPTVRSTTEEIQVEPFEIGMREGSVEVDTLKESVNFDGFLGSRKEGTLGTLAKSAETTNSTGVQKEKKLILI